MDVGRAFTFVFEDDEWVKKIVVVAIIGLIPIIGQLFWLGWSLQITKRVINKDTMPLVGFDDFGGALVLGLKAFVIGFVYAIPIIVLAIPMGVAPALGDTDETVAALSVLSTCCGCLILIYGLLLALIIPAAYGELAATDSLGSAINPGRIYALLQSNFGAYLIAWLGAIAAGFVGGLGAIFCFVGVIFTMAYAYAVIGNLYGQAYNEATASTAA